MTENTKATTQDTALVTEAKYYVAVDLGATSGRVVLAKVSDDGKVDMEVVNRFPNKLIHAQGHYYWDIYALYDHIIEGLKLIAQRGVQPQSIGVDTWGVDFVLVGKDGKLLGLPVAYRDPHTQGAPEEFFKRVSSETLYNKTGLQVMNFNSIFQIDTLKRNGSSALQAADKLLFMPDAISYLLTDKMVTEYTIASTGAIVDARNRRLDPELLLSVGLTQESFGELVTPGHVIGPLSEQVQHQTGLSDVKVIAVAGHDTASAVAAVPATTDEFAYLSSGTWSLMGIEVREPIITDQSRELNYTNEGGVNGTIRFLKNICGMWLLERCRAQWGDDVSYETLITEALQCQPFRSIINPDDPCFANPHSMTKAIKDYCERTHQPVPENRGEFVRCIFESLALRYRQVFDDLCALAPHPLKVLHIIGGGSRNQLLNQWTANSIGVKVIAGPTECTALGNVMIQAGLTRQQIALCVETKEFLPLDHALWTKAYQDHSRIFN